MLCIGHRGAAGYAPENTIAAVEEGIRRGAQWIEIDVYCVEGQLIVFHDDHLERTTNGQGQVMDQSFEYLRSLDAGNGQQIPTLQEVFDSIGQFRCLVGINIELKGPSTAQPVAEFLEQLPIGSGMDLSKFLEYGLLAVSSFQQEQLQQLHQLKPEIPIGTLFWELPDDAIATALSLHAHSINLRFDTVTADIVQAAHAKDLQVWAYTVNEPEAMRQMRSLGVDGIFTDYPERCANLAPT